MLGLRVLSPLPPCSSSIFPRSPPNLTIPCVFLSRTYKPNEELTRFVSILYRSGAGAPVRASRGKKARTSTFMEDEEEEEENEEDEEEEDGEESLPFDEMRKWFRNKPAGFGVGKEYDTSLEEKLLEELEQSRNAQLANINNLKANPLKNTPKQQKQKKALEVVPGTIQVRVGNLPKKKNIHRDLQFAFKGFLGLVRISPAVSGNRKTRDPICKGFAFLYFESEEAANRFVQMYSEQTLPFGKIQKQISCELASSCDSSNSGFGRSTVSTIISSPRLSLSVLQEEMTEDDNIGDLVSDAREVGDQSRLPNAKEITGQVDIGFESVSEMDDEVSSKPSDDERLGQSGSLILSQEQKAVKKKHVAKTKSGRDLRSHKIQNSANRLKIRERAVLTGVLSKYGGKTAAARTP